MIGKFQFGGREIQRSIRTVDADHVVQARFVDELSRNAHGVPWLIEQKTDQCIVAADFGAKEGGNCEFQRSLITTNSGSG